MLWLFREVWREVVRTFVLMELGAVHLLRRFVRPRFAIVGSCHRCGACCERIVAEPPGFMASGRGLVLFVWLHRVWHNFHAVARGPNGEIMFRCGHLTTEKRCGIYRHRPLLCRSYPVLPFFAQPAILPVCGYQIAPVVVTAMTRRASLPIVNAVAFVHHPTPSVRSALAEEPASAFVLHDLAQ